MDLITPTALKKPAVDSFETTCRRTWDAAPDMHRTYGGKFENFYAACCQARDKK